MTTPIDKSIGSPIGKPTNPPSVLLLDFGAVVSKSLFETVAEIESCYGLDAGTLPWHGPFNPTRDALWQDMQNDILSERDYWFARAKELSKLTGNSLTIQDIISRTRPDLDAICRPEAISAINQVRQSDGIVAIATNELLLFYGSDCVNASTVLAGVHHIFDSSYTKILKPDLRAYACIAAGLGVHVSDIVFIDDQIRNVEGATKAGIDSIHLDLTDPSTAFTKALERMKLNCE